MKKNIQAPDCVPTNNGPLLSRSAYDYGYLDRLERVFFDLHHTTFPFVSYDKSSLSSFSYKAVLCNNSFEFFHYSSPIRLNRSPFMRTWFSMDEIVLSLLYACTNEGLSKRKAHAWASSRRLRTIVFGNFEKNDKFISLTFNNQNDFDIYDLKTCNKRKERFIAKLLKLKPDLKYVIVPEYQKRGAVHYHIVCNLPYISKEDFHKLWVYGFSSIGAVGDINKRFNYLAKYITKGFLDPDFYRLRRFYVSNSCLKPVTYYQQAAFDIEHSIERMGAEPIIKKEYSPRAPKVVSLTKYVAYKIQKNVK